ncbi:MAG TPA: TIGR03435 family protein [Candidatus Solibacter sp.]|nr:TIGR03435 family protein [Candidatus Solibacter sp.]
MRLRYLALIIAAAATVWGQSFEVASVKAAPPPEGRGFTSTTHYDRALYTATNVTLKGMLMTAFDIKDYQIQCPAWMETARFNISARVPEGTPRDQINPMLQKLLVERFQIELRRDRKEMAAYTLTVAKNGPKLKETDPDSEAANTAPAIRNGTREGTEIGAGRGISAALGGARSGKDAFPVAGKGGFSSQTTQGRTRVAADGQPIANLATFLSRSLQHEVVDKTGLTGKYDFRLEFAADTKAPVQPDGAAEPEAPTIFRALQDQLGLKLEAGRTQLDFIVIEKAEKTPIEN